MGELKPIGGSAEPSRPEAGSRPQAPRIPITTAPISATPTFRAVAQPVVKSYHVRVYECKAEDSWDSICRKEYLTDRYAEALRVWNQNNAQASDHVRQGRPLVPGEKVYIPPATLLQEQHGPLIRPAATSAGPTAPGGSLPGQAN